MPQQIVIAEQLRIAAVLQDDRVDELVVAQGRYQIGDVYVGIVENVLPGIDAAFVNIGESEKNGFIHVTDLGPLRLRKGAAGITELLEPRQKVLVQVMKEPTGTKGPRLTGNLTLPGRFLVLQPQGQGVNLSRRINSEDERNRLRALGVLIKPPGAGLLIRTEAEEVSEELLIDDLEGLLRQWEAIQQAAENAVPPVLLNRDEDFVHRVLRDLHNPDVVKVVLDSSGGAARARAFLGIDPSGGPGVGAVALAIDEAELHLLGDLGVQREVGAGAVEGRAERGRLARPDLVGRHGSLGVPQARRAHQSGFERRGPAASSRPAVGTLGPTRSRRRLGFR